ncbi:MAG: heme-copper oxidase subunit III [Candidatus Poribacteria bacterium]
MEISESSTSSDSHRDRTLQSKNNARLAILVLLGAEFMLFAGLIGAFLVFRLGSITWPPPSQVQIRLPIAVTGINTIILLLSGYTMFQALRAIRKNRHKELKIWLILTAILGSVFLVVQGSEWIRLVHHGLTLSSGIYGSIFYVLIGCHALHVLGALLWLLTVLVLAVNRRFSPNHHVGVELCTIYWTFVVGLWPFLYVLVYLA